MKSKIIILFLAFTIAIEAQNQFQSFLSKVDSVPTVEGKTSLVDSFMIFARTKGIPFIDSNYAVFLYRGTSNPTQIAGDFTGWQPVNMTNISSTNFFYYIRNFEMNARLDYKFILSGGTWILDPENPKHCPGGYGPNSELAMPAYIQPWEIVYNQKIKHGTTELESIKSSYTNKTYQLRIYLPPDYDAARTVKYPTVYFQDGTDYINLASCTNVIDNLLDSNKIEPFISVFVPPTNRNDEYAYSLRNAYSLFFINELVPFIDSIYNTERDAKRRLVLGDSFGGNISALISYYNPDVFANCGQQSGAFWTNNYEVSLLLKLGAYKPIKIYSVWGTYADVADDWQIIKDSLISKGYDFEWQERPEGHSWGLWRATLDDMFKYYFPANQTKVEITGTENPGQYLLSQNYPNPFNPVTTIKFSVPILPTGQVNSILPMSFVSLKVYDILGKEAAILVNEELPAGDYEVEWDATNFSSGIYFCALRAGIFKQTKKMCLTK